MAKLSAITWALVLGSALVVTGAATAFGLSAVPATAPTQTVDTRPDPGIGADAVPAMSTEPWPAVTESGCTACPTADPGNVTVILAARWGYLDDPTVAGLSGLWRFNDTSGTTGRFLGVWTLAFGRLSGSVRGGFSLPADGHGAFRGRWSIFGIPLGGYLWGDWVRVNATSGYFDGKWNQTGGRAAGVVEGRWSQPTADGGGFRGLAVAAPTMAPVDWDGSLHTTEGVTHILRPVRFEPDDKVLRQADPQTAGWNSTTTVNWDGILAVVRYPASGPAPDVTLETAQKTFTWSADQLAGLHVRETVDSAGHAIEVFAFVLQPRPVLTALKIEVRWGNLSSQNGTDLPTGMRTYWNGSAWISHGALAVARILSFERGDWLLLGNLSAARWRSSTTTGWDGIVLGVVVPRALPNDTSFVLTAGSFSHTFTIPELVGDHVFDVGNGNQVEVHAVWL